MTSVLGRFYAAIIVSGLFASTVTDACSADSELGHFVNERYGKRIEFDVLRDGKPVGEHVTTFALTANGLKVHSRTELGISVLFIPVYRFEYDSQSLWCGESLSRLSARTKDRGENTLTEVEPAAGGLVVRHEGREQQVAENLIPTDHWNPHVLQRSEVLNTITGRVNTVQISSCTSHSKVVATAAPGGSCYQYSGDLEARVWYDESMRWVGLEFAGRDGSEIVYVCRDCRAEGV